MKVFQEKIFKFTMFLSGFFLTGLAVFTTPASAQNLLPQQIQDLLSSLGPGGEGTAEFISSRVRNFLILGLGVLILFAVVFIVIAALRYIRSQGEEGEVEGAKKGIEAIFQGLIIMLIAFIGIIVVFVIFGTNPFNPSIYQVCVSAPNSVGCIQGCQADGGGLPDDWNTVKFNPANPGTVGGTPKQLCTLCEWEYFTISRGGSTPISAECKE